MAILLGTGMISCGGGGSSSATDPQTPAAPSAPANPSMPSTPAEPTTPSTPTEPAAPSRPSTPTEPAAPSTPPSDDPGSELPVIQLRAGPHLINAEVASTPEQHEKGLMFREELAENNGMLFVFSELTTICMWMQNTYIPLSVAFIDQDGVIVNIEDMVPLTTDLKCSRRLARYSLEMNQGWFERNNVLPGSSIEGLP